MAPARKRIPARDCSTCTQTIRLRDSDLNAFYDRNTLSSKYPQFLSGQQESIQDSSGNDVGVGAQHNLPLHGQFYANYTRASADTNYFSDAGQVSTTSSYTDDIVNSGASFHPTEKLSLNVPRTTPAT